jgi:hypothetical protein
MAVSKVDRNSNFMSSAWGTNSLITDYVIQEKKVIQEVMYDPANTQKSNQTDIYENVDENDFEYGIEPTYKLNKGQKVL